jgi:hypothetical protein
VVRSSTSRDFRVYFRVGFVLIDCGADDCCFFFSDAPPRPRDRLRLGVFFDADLLGDRFFAGRDRLSERERGFFADDAGCCLRGVRDRGDLATGDLPDFDFAIVVCDVVFKSMIAEELLKLSAGSQLACSSG